MIFRYKPIYTEEGHVLVGHQVELTTSMLRKLSQLGVNYLYIEDSRTEDIHIEDPIHDQTRSMLRTGALLHDVGNVQIPTQILEKKTPLTSNEYMEVKKHAEYGFLLLRDTIGVPLVAAHCALQHHERMNGSGSLLDKSESKYIPMPGGSACLIPTML